MYCEGIPAPPYGPPGLNAGAPGVITCAPVGAGPL